MHSLLSLKVAQQKLALQFVSLNYYEAWFPYGNASLTPGCSSSGRAPFSWVWGGSGRYPVLEPAPAMWKTHMELLAPVFSLDQSWPLQPFGQ